ncbi:serine hydrolase domain-containing protein [Pseudonocardia spinosispora]|uniref:serine hydrolase domain-containing protein n=1 Tax=Pseudonocardia spinosispora TaxID=103441 RepID=UPI00041B32AB|nr:serine hydrolase domain-containing protein [Pseudonocardia spinosispora]
MSTSDIDRVLRDAVAEEAVPHIVATVTDRSGTVYAGAAGSVTPGGCESVAPDSLFRIASMTKIVTTVAALQQVERGNLDLDDPVDAYLPGFADLTVLDGFDGDRPRMRPPARRATVGQLLTHTSGLGYWFWNADIQRWETLTGTANALGGDRDGFFSAPLVADPGERFEYGISTDWLGQVVEKASGTSLDDYFRREVFEPLKMPDTTFTPDAEARNRLVPLHARTPDGGWQAIDLDLPQPPPWYSGGHGLYSTPNDFLRLQRALLNGGSLDGSAVLRQATVESMFRNQLGTLSFPAHIPTADPVVASTWDGPSGLKWGYGVLLTTEQEPGYRSPGSGSWAGLFNTYFWVDPGSDLTGAIYSQFVPFADPAILGVCRDVEKQVYRTLR